MNVLCQTIMMGYKVTSLCTRLSISPKLLKTYMTFLETHHIVQTIPYFWSDKRRELSHQECLVIDDMGLISACTHIYTPQLHNHTLTRNFVYLELRYVLPDGDTIMTYKRTNGSVIDFVIVHTDETLTVIAVCMTDSICVPKAFHAFHITYGHRVRQYIKTTHLTYHRGIYQSENASSIPYITIPHFFIKNVLTSV
jgi:predicted AAA+ superfamily ATPase